MRYDKYDPKVGGFRAPLAGDQATVLEGALGEADAPVGAALDANGRVVPLGDATANTGLVGVLATVRPMVAGDIVDIMTSGEIVDFGGVAGTDYFVRADGTIGAAATGDNVYLGTTVEADRLVVRLGSRPVTTVA